MIDILDRIAASTRTVINDVLPEEAVVQVVMICSESRDRDDGIAFKAGLIIPGFRSIGIDIEKEMISFESGSVEQISVEFSG